MEIVRVFIVYSVKRLSKDSQSYHTIHQGSQQKVQIHPSQKQSQSFLQRHQDYKILTNADPVPEAGEQDIIYQWKCPSHNHTAEYIGESNRSLRERVSDHRNQTTSAIRNHHISTKHPKAELKDFTVIDRENNTLYHQAKEALHIWIKDPSLNRNTGKVRTAPVFNKLPSPQTQLQSYSAPSLHPREHFLHLVFQNNKELTPSLISIYKHHLYVYTYQTSRQQNL